MNMRSFALAGLAACVLAFPAAASVAASGTSGSGPAKVDAVRYAAVQCMTDDGYGRKRPCSSLYKKENPNWRAGNECMTDDGHGRYRPCSSLYKQKHQK
jgi:hypothetical protein